MKNSLLIYLSAAIDSSLSAHTSPTTSYLFRGVARWQHNTYLRGGPRGADSSADRLLLLFENEICCIRLLPVSVLKSKAAASLARAAAAAGWQTRIM